MKLRTGEQSRAVVQKSILLTLDTHCCHKGTAIKHDVPGLVKQSFDIRALQSSGQRQSARMSKLQMRA